MESPRKPKNKRVCVCVYPLLGVCGHFGGVKCIFLAISSDYRKFDFTDTI